jgi:hypothetical protein
MNLLLVFLGVDILFTDYGDICKTYGWNLKADEGNVEKLYKNERTHWQKTSEATKNRLDFFLLVVGLSASLSLQRRTPLNKETRRRNWRPNTTRQAT